MKGLLFVYLMTYGGAVVALFRPYVGFLVYIVLAIIRPESMWYWSIGAGSFSKIIGVAMLAGWVLQGFGNWQFGRARGIVTALLAYWAWLILCTLLAPIHDPDPAKDMAWYFVDIQTKTVLPCLVGITLIDSVAKLKQLIWTIVLSQAFVALDLNQSYFSGYNKLWLDGFGGMDNNCVAIALVTCLGPAIFLGLEDRQWWRKGLAAVSVLLILHAILFSDSRGGMLATIIAAILIFVLMPKRPQNLLAFALAVALGLSLAGKGVSERFATIFASKENRDESAQSRLDLWEDCLDAIQKRPVFGVGPWHWETLALTEYRWGVRKAAHNLWLQTATEVGLPGVGLLLTFYGLTLVRLLPLTRARCPVIDPWCHCGARIVIVAIVGFAVSACFVSLQLLETPFYITIMGAGLLKLSSAATDRERDEGPYDPTDPVTHSAPLSATSHLPS